MRPRLRGRLYRLLLHAGEPREGTFVLCNFWLVQCLALSGRLAEAEQQLESTVRAADHLGLFAEMFDPAKGLLLGNFPQGFTPISAS